MEKERNRFVVVPIKQVDVFAAIQEKLVDMIDRGGYSEGDKLPGERELAVQLNVSRNAVREVLKVLEAIGRVRIAHGSGTFVAGPRTDPISDHLRPELGFGQDDIQHLAELRAAIAIRIAELAARNATDEDIRELSAVLSEAEEDLEQAPETGSLDVAFEEALGRSSRNPLLLSMQTSIDHLWVEAWGGLRSAPGTRVTLHAQHLQIFEAVKRGDSEEASRLMRFHLDRDIDWDHGREPRGHRDHA